MKSVIEEIYSGSRGFYQDLDVGDKYREIDKDYNKVHDELEESLNEKQKKLLDELFLISGGLEGAIGGEHFKEGFKLGLLVAIEAFTT